MKSVLRNTTIGGQPGTAWYSELTTEEDLAFRKYYWNLGLVRVYREHPKGRAYSWQRAKPYMLEELSRTRQIRDVTELEYFA